jgi:glycosyltransferase involved in cell wall biosynthesis
MQKVSLIISVYNQPYELELVFHALTVQSFKNFEAIIADDGSGAEIDELISKWKSKNVFEINHVKQEHLGFRVAKIHNEAVLAAKTDYIIFIDADCIPHSDFIKAHWDNREQNTILCGRRMDLNKEYSDKLTNEKILSLQYQKVGLKHIWESFKKTGPKGIEDGWIVKSPALKKIFKKKDIHLLGSNFSLPKQTIEKVNGFDENFVGYGLGFDTEFEFRLRLAGVTFKSVRNLAIQFHLYHPKRKMTKENVDYFEKMKSSGDYICKNGLVKLS